MGLIWSVIMKIIERMKNIFVKQKALPQTFVRDANFDVVFLTEIFNGVPEVISAPNRKMYVYFDVMDENQIQIVRAMGFNPRLHTSRKDGFPKKYQRAKVSASMSKSARNIVKILAKANSSQDFWDFRHNLPSYELNSAYKKYIADFKHSLQKTTR